MRIAIFSESYVPNISGVAVFVRQLALGLKEAGHEVIVCSASPTGKPYTEEIDNITVHRIRSIPNPVKRKFRLVMRQERTINRILGSFQPDIVHAQDPGGGAAAAMKFAKRHHIPVVGTYHFTLEFVASYIPFSKYVPGNLKPFIRAYCNDFYDQCTLITCPTQPVKEDLKKQKIKPPVRVISNGIDTSSPLSKQQRDSWEHRVPRLLSVGRIDEEKNLLTLFRALTFVLPIHQVHLTVVGDGNKRKVYERWVRQHGLSEYISFTGGIPMATARLYEEYALSDIFVISSLIETQSIVTMEAMLASMPIVAAKSGALPELIKDEKNGLLVDPVNPKTFAQAIIKAIEQPIQMLKMGKQAHQDISVHSLGNTIQAFVDLYRELTA